MQDKVPVPELRERLDRFRSRMDTDHPDWAFASIFGNVNQYYFTGTMQDGVLLIPRDDAAVLWVRRSYERARSESLFPDIRSMGSYRDAARGLGALPDAVYLETDVVPLAVVRRFQKYFPFRRVEPLDAQVMKVRSVKSPFEQSRLERAGRIHRYILEDCVPALLREGMTEAELGGEIFAAMVREGHHGIVRFGMFNTEIVMGQMGFGESSIYPTYFNGPGGCRGIGPAAPVLGSPDRALRKGDLVFVDNACGVDGYHTDKTVTYMFGAPLPDDAVEAHQRCVKIQREAASLLKPGTSPAEMYETVMEGLETGFRENFMGFGDRRVNFLGHGVGLQVDEQPVIAKGFDEPLQEGMAIALEPKKGIRGVGLVGIEDTFLVTPQGGRSLTGQNPGLIPVY